MSAMYWAELSNGQLVTVYSADARSFKRKDIRAAYTKARKKALAKAPKGVKVVRIRCVG